MSDTVKTILNEAAMSPSLSQEQRIQMLAAIKRSLLLASPHLPSEPNPSRPAGMKRIEDHLDALVEIVRRTAATQIESFAWQILEDICDCCPSQNANCHCPLRKRNLCALYGSIPAIVETIAGELVAMKDEAYLQTHPQCY
jgi:hypothetical protein